MRRSATLIFLCTLVCSTSWAADVRSCSDLSGRWEAKTDSHHFTMNVSPSLGGCGSECVVLNAEYNVSDPGILNNTYRNKLYCHEGVEGVKGQGPMVIAFEGAYGGQSIGTYNRQLKTLWAGVIQKDRQGNWEKKMENYWFNRRGN